MTFYPLLLGKREGFMNSKKSETPFMDSIKEHGKKHHKQNKWLKRSETKRQLEKLIPEPIIPEVEGKPIEDLRASWRQNGEIKIIEQIPARIISYTPKKNPDLRLLFNFSFAKVYFNVETSDFWLYVFSDDRKRLIRRMRIEDHDIANLFAFYLNQVYGSKIPDVIRIDQNIKKRTAKIKERMKDD
jgi:hypothetical protein